MKMIDFNEYPGGRFSFNCGILLSLAIATIAALNLYAGLAVLAAAGILFYLTIRNVIKDESLITVFSATFASLPFILSLYFLFLVFFSFNMKLILLLF